MCGSGCRVCEIRTGVATKIERLPPSHCHAGGRHLTGGLPLQASDVIGIGAPSTSKRRRRRLFCFEFDNLRGRFVALGVARSERVPVPKPRQQAALTRTAAYRRCCQAGSVRSSRSEHLDRQMESDGEIHKVSRPFVLNFCHIHKSSLSHQTIFRIQCKREGAPGTLGGCELPLLTDPWEGGRGVTFHSHEKVHRQCVFTF